MPILRGTNSALLPCGCLIGLYETYRGQTVALVDVKGPSCTEHLHRVNACVQWNALPSHTPDRTATPLHLNAEAPRR